MKSESLKLRLSAALRKAYESHCRRTHIYGRDDKAFMDAIVRGTVCPNCNNERSTDSGTSLCAECGGR